MPFVSIVIPTYNRAHCICRAVDSVLSQSFPDFEVLVVDDGSTDETPQALRPYQNQVRYIRQENKGVCAARNLGIQNSRGEWIAFLDSDDEWLPTKLEVQARDIRSNPGICLHTTNALLINPKGAESDLFQITGYAGESQDDHLLLRPLTHQVRYGVARVQCMMARRDAIVAAGLFRLDHPLPLYEDQDLACRLALQGPWITSRRKLVRIMRSKEDKSNLSRLRLEESVRSVETLVQIYERLLTDSRLDREEMQLVNYTLNIYRGMLGMRLLEAGQQRQARKVLSLAFRQTPSASAIIKCALASLPLGVAPALARQWNTYRGRI